MAVLRCAMSSFAVPPVVIAGIVFAACSSSPASHSSHDGSPADAPSDGPAATSSTASIGPAGALDAPTSITVAVASDAPPLPANLTALGDVFSFTPHGQAFADRVTINVPFTAPATGTPQLYGASADDKVWAPVTDATTAGGALSTQVLHFSYFVVVVGPSGCGKIGAACSIEMNNCCIDPTWAVECDFNGSHLCVVQLGGPCSSGTDCRGNGQNPPEAACLLGTCCAMSGFACSKDSDCCSGSCPVSNCR